VTYSSRGDFQPFLTLALGLQKAGHTVRLAGPGRFAGFAAAHGVPFAALARDQPFWGKRFAALGARPRPILVKKLDADSLTAALRQADDDPMRRRAADAGGKTRSEDGVGTAVKLIEAWGTRR